MNTYGYLQHLLEASAPAQFLGTACQSFFPEVARNIWLRANSHSVGSEMLSHMGLAAQGIQLEKSEEEMW